MNANKQMSTSHKNIHINLLKSRAAGVGASIGMVDEISITRESGQHEALG
jgi:hypothetical protein